MTQTPADFRALADRTIDQLSTYLSDLCSDEAPATGFAPLQTIFDELQIEHWIDHAGMDPSAYQAFLKKYLGYSVQIHHPRYMAHQVATPDTPGILAGMINSVLQNPMAIYEMGPAASAMELAVVAWMCKKIGWPKPKFPFESDKAPSQAGGVLTHGGSLANLTALLAARSKFAPNSWNQGHPGDLAIMAPQASHYSVARAASVLGIGANQVFSIATNDLGVVKVEALEATLQKLQAAGKRCMALVANACSTASGLHDPLEEIGRFCQAKGLWFHVDACHGASGLVSKQLAPDLKGIELADSVVWDAHKMMQIPVLCAALLVRDANSLRGIFAQDANYLAFDEDPERYSALPFAIECTKSSMSLKLFLSLAMRGEQGIAQYIEGRYALAKGFYDYLEDQDDFHCLCAPQTNILCFRFGDQEALQAKIRDRMLCERNFHLSSAKVSGKTYLRVALMNPRTDLNVLKKLVDEIRICAQALQAT